MPPDPRNAASGQILGSVASYSEAEALYAERARLNAQLEVYRRTARPTSDIKSRIAEIGDILGRYEQHERGGDDNQA